MWIHVPKSIHPYPSVVDMEGLSLHSDKLSELERFAMWKSESRSAKSWSTLWTKNSSMRLLSGLTSPTSQLTSSVIAATSYRAASLVSHFRLPENASKKTIPEIYGRQSLGSYEALGHQSSFWRTSLGFSPIISTPSDPNFLRWVTWCRKVYSQRELTVAHRRSVRGSSSWPTPRGRDCKGEGYHDTLPTTSMNWPSPDSNTSNYSGEGYGPNLREKVTNWPTPRASIRDQPTKKEFEAGNPKTRLEAEAALFADQKENWETPQSRDYKGKNTGSQETLPNQTLNWPNSRSSRLDPTTQEGGSGFSPDGPSSVPPIARKDTTCSPTCRRLRVEFAEWLMGLPPGWTNASERLATGLYRSHVLSHSIRLAEEGFFDDSPMA